MKRFAQYVIGLLLLCTNIGQAQDIQFSQFYANMLYLNPAFAGSAHMSRAIFHQRIQWPSLDAKYLTSSFSLDHQFEKYNSGLGLLVIKDWQGASTINSTEIALQYAYELILSRTFSLRTGVEANYVSRSLDYGYLTMPDQYDNNGFQTPKSTESFGNNRVQYGDLSAGSVFYSDLFWVGVAVKHLNRPEQSFYGGASSSRLPMKVDLTAGTKFYLEKPRSQYGIDVGKEISVTPTAHYKSQGKSDQVDFGIYGLYDRMIAGFWYRGIPLLKQYRQGLANNESMVFLAGWRIQRLSISYSYDVTVSKLHRATTGGSHELNITYMWEYPKKKRKPMRRLPCPDLHLFQ